MRFGYQCMLLLAAWFSPWMGAASAADRGLLLWQTNSEGNDIHIFSVPDFQLVRRLEVGPEPHGIAAPDDGRMVYVSLEANGRDHGELLWIDPETMAIKHRLAVGPEPHAIATTPDGRWIYVPCRDGSYWVVDAEARRVVKRIETGGRPHNTRASRDGRFMYLSPMGSKGLVTVVDVLAGHNVVSTIAFDESVRPSALSRNGQLLLQHIDGLNGFQVAETNPPRLMPTVRRSTELGWFLPMKSLGYLTFNGFNRCHGLDIRPDQREVWSLCARYLTVHHFQPPLFEEVSAIELDGKGYWLTFSPDSRYAFIALADRNQVAVLRTEDKQVIRRLEVGKAPKRNLVISSRGHRGNKRAE
jgi:DNA-binding beta-propeller fold protein YncE